MDQLRPGSFGAQLEVRFIKRTRFLAEGCANSFLVFASQKIPLGELLVGVEVDILISEYLADLVKDILGPKSELRQTHVVPFEENDSLAPVLRVLATSGGVGVIEDRHVEGTRLTH